MFTSTCATCSDLLSSTMDVTCHKPSLTLVGQRTDSILQGTDLQGTDLQGTDLQGTDLQGTDLQGTDLQRTDLQGTDLW